MVIIIILIYYENNNYNIFDLIEIINKYIDTADRLEQDKSSDIEQQPPLVLYMSDIQMYYSTCILYQYPRMVFAYSHF